MDSIFDSAAAKIRIASLVSPLMDLESLAAELKHLRHEGNSVKLCIIVECPQNFFLASYFHPIANGKPFIGSHHVCPSMLPERAMFRGNWGVDRSSHAGQNSKFRFVSDAQRVPIYGEPVGDGLSFAPT